MSTALKKCNHCDKNIFDAELINRVIEHNQSFWHKNHLFCTLCEKLVNYDSVHFRNKTPYHNECKKISEGGLAFNLRIKFIKFIQIDKTTYYGFSLTKDNYSWQIYKRFSEFVELEDKLRLQFTTKQHIKLKAHKALINTEATIFKRREYLFDFLFAILQDDEMHTAACVLEFIRPILDCVLDKCFNILKNVNGVSGLIRESGTAALLLEIRNQISLKISADLSNILNDSHSLVGVIKMIFMATPNERTDIPIQKGETALIWPSLHDAYVTLSASEEFKILGEVNLKTLIPAPNEENWENNARIPVMPRDIVRQVLQKLISPPFGYYKHLARFLFSVTEKDKNMSISNIVKIMNMNLLVPPGFLITMIKECDYVFN